MNAKIEKARNVVFDIGNVLLSFCPNKFIPALLPADAPAALAHAMFGCGAWEMTDAGIIGDETAAARICAFAGCAGWEAGVLRVMHGFPDYMEELPAVSLLPHLKTAGKRIFALSNFPAASFETTRRKFHFFNDLMDGYIISSLVRLNKPDEAIYRTLLEKYSLDPAETVFLDDTERNVRGAEKLGISGILYTGPESLA